MRELATSRVDAHVSIDSWTDYCSPYSSAMLIALANVGAVQSSAVCAGASNNTLLLYANAECIQLREVDSVP